jgi:hypothetical protein
MSPFRQLVALNLDRYYASEVVDSDTGFETNVYAILAFIAVIPMWFGVLGPLFLIAFAFAVTGFATAFEWDMLFPDRRDFLVLTPFPIRMRHLFAAKLASLGIFLSAVLAAVHAYIPLFLFQSPMGQSAPLHGIRRIAAQLAATLAASLFSFLAVAGFQGLCINLLGPRLYPRLSPWLQTIAMCVMIFSLFLFPVYVLAVHAASAGHANWVWWIPPYWFWGIAALFAPDSPNTALGIFGLKALTTAFLVFCGAWATGYTRHYRRTLESEDVGTIRPAPGRRFFEQFLDSPVPRAIYRFTGQTVARSVKHRLFFVTYLSAGVSLGVLMTVTFLKGKIGISAEGLRAFPPLVVFLAISGFRAAFQFPSELPANWLYRITESNWREAGRAASLLRVLVSGLLPALLLLTPLEIGKWGWKVGLFHMTVQAMAGLILIEILFYSFDKIPFTCSYFPGGLNLIFLAAAYLFGFTGYGYEVGDLEVWLESRPLIAVLILSVAAALLVAIRRFRPSLPAPIRFDGGEPEIQTLNLT